MFDIARITASKLVARIDYHESLGSTSDRALALAAEGAIELPLLVLTERQTAGRGRGANRWWASEGALTFSLVLEAPAEKLPISRWPQVALVAGLAVCEALESLAPSAALRVKWPNDVYLGSRKVCGILSETVPGWRDRLVVGVGINVNNGEVSCQLSVVSGEGGDRGQGTGGAGQAVALVEEDGLVRDLTDVLLAVLDQFDRRWSELIDGGFVPLAAEYRERCYLTGKTVTIEQPGARQVVGACQGIDEAGLLVLRTETGEQRLSSGSVVRWED
jgi:BirA family transcriptional regulator, biotin operon repressor / biotin---[acetyl-CoA-carboxylase] ligase